MSGHGTQASLLFGRDSTRVPLLRAESAHARELDVDLQI